jgi:hypothetical protein
MVQRSLGPGWVYAAIALVPAACGDSATGWPGSASSGSASSGGGTSGSSSGGTSGSSSTSSGAGSTGSSGSSGSGGSGSNGGGSSGGSSGGGDDAGAWDSSAPPWDGSLGDAGCGQDPTAGFTEYQDTYKVQFPYNLMQADRFSVANGIYTAWIYPTDMPFSMGSPTAPRTEMRWLQNWNTGEREWEADVLVDSPTDHSCIMQVKTDTPGGHEAIYLDVYKGNLQNGPGPIIATNVIGQWMHLNVAYNTATRVARVWLDGCMIFTRTHPVDALWYFKNGVYGCDTNVCRSHYQNIRFWQR